MKLCFSTLGCADYPLSDILALCGRFGISCLEIRGIGGQMDFSKIPEFSKERISQTRNAFKSAAVTPLILGTSCQFHTEEKKQKALAEGGMALEYAREIGAMGIRVFGNNLTDDPAEATRNIIEGISLLCEKARQTDVNVLLEVHGDFHTVETLSPILHALQNEPRFGLIWDIEHTHSPYGERWMDFYQAVAPFIRHVHIKDKNQKGLVLPGEGEIPILPLVKRLLSDGYSGAFSLEWEKKWHPELPPIEPALERFTTLMKQVDEKTVEKSEGQTMNTLIAITRGTTRSSFLTEENMALLHRLGEVREVEGDLTEENVIKSIGNSEIYMTCWGSPRLNEAILQAAPNLKLLVHLCGTVAPFVSEAMWKRGIRVISGNAFFAESTAEGTLSYILTAQRDIPFYATDLKEKKHWKTRDSKSRSLLGKTVGIVSYGAVARNLVKMLQPFRVRILIYDIYPLSQAEKDKYGMEQVDLETLFSKSDIISVHTPLNDETHHLIGKNLFEKIRPDALFVNASRGKVIDQSALEAELETGRFRALLDVYEKEPPAPDCRLYTLPNVIMMPHMAGPTTDLHPEIALALIREANDFLANDKPLLYEITEAVANRMSEK